jgi:dihydropteroate synthase
MNARRAAAPGVPDAVVARVVWVEDAAAGPLAVDAPSSHRLRFEAGDARVGFAAARGRGVALGLATVEWTREQPLPRASDPRWNECAFVLPLPRASDVEIVVRESTLERASGPLGAELRRALAEWRRPERRWRIGAGRELVLRHDRPAVMGVLNVTPDSFSDGGRWNATSAVARGEEFAKAGAALVDVGGESTRPGAQPVSEQVELERVLPVVERLAARVAVPISVDTTKAAVARAAIAAGASVVNDTSALADDPQLARVVVESGAGLVLMHRLGPPTTMQDAPHYDDCSAEVADHLAARARLAVEQGVARESVVLDPGVGFGKRLADNLELVGSIGSLRSLGFPLLLGASRKSFLGAVTGRAPHEREAATLATTAVAFASGCELVRVHDAIGSIDLLRVLAAVRDREAAPRSASSA